MLSAKAARACSRILAAASGAKARSTRPPLFNPAAAAPGALSPVGYAVQAASVWPAAASCRSRRPDSPARWPRACASWSCSSQARTAVRSAITTSRSSGWTGRGAGETGSSSECDRSSPRARSTSCSPTTCASSGTVARSAASVSTSSTWREVVLSGDSRRRSRTWIRSGMSPPATGAPPAPRASSVRKNGLPPLRATRLCTTDSEATGSVARSWSISRRARRAVSGDVNGVMRNVAVVDGTVGRGWSLSSLRPASSRLHLRPSVSVQSRDSSDRSAASAQCTSSTTRASGSA
ncbi:hypothetical protein [Ornithinimicrobium kibberense]|uniref:hypothetical protein n=1 Tax=Ornithinimicrobium kibberense TaxID=282060 RepID=UPI00361B80D4